jgi:hypothetical protein
VTIFATNRYLGLAQPCAAPAAFGKRAVWFWPKIAAALTSKHHWLVIASDSCGTVLDLDLRVKPRDPEASVRVALRDVR